LREGKDKMNSADYKEWHITAITDGPVLLVDDIIDSGWTLTMAGYLLRKHGSGPVYPFTLAQAAARNGNI
jgi:ATP-dependent DNA helicase RecQ